MRSESVSRIEEEDERRPGPDFMYGPVTNHRLGLVIKKRLALERWAPWSSTGPGLWAGSDMVSEEETLWGREDLAPVRPETGGWPVTIYANANEERLCGSSGGTGVQGLES